MANVREKPLIRYFCEVTDQANPDEETWGDVGFDYLKALADAGFPLRVLAHGAMRLAGQRRYHNGRVIKDSEQSLSRWEPYRVLFGTPMQSPYINVVCGGANMLAHYWTQGPKNIAITADINSQASEVAGADDIHAKYDLVVCLTEDEATAFFKLGVVAMHLQPAELPQALLSIKDPPNE